METFLLMLTLSISDGPPASATRAGANLTASTTPKEAPDVSHLSLSPASATRRGRSRPYRPERVGRDYPGAEPGSRSGAPEPDSGAAVGELTIRLAHVGRDVDTAEPTWPVEGIMFVSGADPQRAFAAEVHGTIDWRTKRVRLVGDVSLGYLRGAHLEQTAGLVNYDLSGDLRLTPATLAAR